MKHNQDPALNKKQAKHRRGFTAKLLCQFDDGCQGGWGWVGVGRVVESRLATLVGGGEREKPRD